MKTIMIIDDEPLIRRGLESMIPWESLPYQLLGQASNGEEGLNKIREWKPDVVITDIKMPKMDGLSMIKEAMKEPNPPVFIVLSGYEDFDLVRSAMRLGAMDYLLKLSLDENEITRVLTEAGQMVRGNQPTGGPVKSDFKENFLKELLLLRDDKVFLEKMGQKTIAVQEGYYYRFLCLKLLELPPENWNADNLSQNFLVNICREQIPEGVETYQFKLDQAAYGIYIESEGILPPDHLTALCKAMGGAVKQYLNQEVMMGISAPHHNIIHVTEALDEALQSVAFRISGEGKQVHSYTDLLNEAYFMKQLDHLKAEPDFTDALETLILQFQKFVAQKATLREARQICLKLITTVYEMDGESRSFFTGWLKQTYETIEDLESLTDEEAVSSWLLRLEQGLISFSQQYMGEIYRYKVKRAKQYIYENRYQKIALHEVAAQLEITPGYLSRIFKKVTQMSFSDYITQVKMEEAKTLLLRDNNRIYEVSSILGYEDPYYFSKVFKRVTQMTPSEYIARKG